MFPFQNIPHQLLNIDLSSSQSIPFPSQYLPKQPEMSPRMPQMYNQDPQSAYNNMQSLLNKRSPQVDLHSHPNKHIHQESTFSFPPEAYRMQELPKNMMQQSKSDDMNTQKLLLRAQQEMYGMPKGPSMSAQQFPGFANNMGFSNLDLSQLEAQGYLGETASQAYIRQYLESKGMNMRDYAGQIPPQMNDNMQKYMSNLYGLPNNMQPNMNLQNPAGLGNIGNLGNLSNLGNLAGLANLSNLAGLVNLGNIGNMGNLGNLGNMSNLGNVGNLNNPLMMDLLNQNRNQQQLLQQLNQYNNMQVQQLLPSLQEAAKLDPSLRNINLAELMMLGSSGPQNNLVDLRTLSMPPTQIQQGISPSSIASKSTAQTLVLQRPEPLRQENLQRQESSNQGKAVPVVPIVQVPQEMNEEVNGRASMQLKPEPKVKRDIPQPQERLIKNKPEQEREMKDIKLPVREEREPEKVQRQVEVRIKKPESQRNTAPQQPVMPETNRWSNTKEPNGERRKNKLQLQAEQAERTMMERNAKESLTQGTERQQKRIQTFGGAIEIEQSQANQDQQNIRGRRSDSMAAGEVIRTTSRTERMGVNNEERKNSASRRFSQNEVLAKPNGYLEMEKTSKLMGNENSRKGTSMTLTMEDTRAQAMKNGLYEMTTTSHMNLGENYYKSPERIQEEPGVQKTVLTRVGLQYQTMIPDLTLNDEDDEEHDRRKRNYKLTWDPQAVNSKEIANYVKGLHRVLGMKVISQEKALKLLAKKNFDIDEVIRTVKGNERFYSNYFGLSSCTRELRSRRNID